MPVQSSVCGATCPPTRPIRASWPGVSSPSRGTPSWASRTMPCGWRRRRGRGSGGRSAAGAPFGTPWPTTRSLIFFISAPATGHRGITKCARRGAATICFSHPSWRCGPIRANTSGTTRRPRRKTGTSRRPSPSSSPTWRSRERLDEFSCRRPRTASSMCWIGRPESSSRRNPSRRSTGPVTWIWRRDARLSDPACVPRETTR